jgi:hypothetical protein
MKMSPKVKVEEWNGGFDSFRMKFSPKVKFYDWNNHSKSSRMNSLSHNRGDENNYSTKELDLH